MDALAYIAIVLAIAGSIALFIIQNLNKSKV